MCMSRGTGLAKLSPLPLVAAPCCLRPACTTGMGSHSRLPTFGRWSRGCGSPRPHQPLRQGETPRPAGTYWIFLVKFLETIPPSTCCSSCLPAGKDNTPRHHLTGRLFFPNKQQLNPTAKFSEELFPFPCTNPSLWRGLREPLLRGEGDAGHSAPIFPVRAWGLAGCQERGLKKNPPDVIKPLETAASPLVPSPGWSPLHRAVRLGVPVPGASLKLKPCWWLPGPP